MKKSISEQYVAAVHSSLILSGIRRFFSSVIRLVYPQPTTSETEGGYSHSSESGRRLISRSFYNGYLAKLYRKSGDALLATGCRSYGIMGLSFSVVTVLYFFLQLLFPALPGTFVLTELMPSFFIAVIGLVFLCIDRTLYDTLYGNTVFKFLLVDFLGISPEDPDPGAKSIPMPVSALFGCLFGALGIFYTPGAAVTIALIGILFFTIMDTSEFSLSLAIILVPFTVVLDKADIWLFFTVATGILSYSVKLLLGKRRFTASPFDIPVTLAVLLSLFGGIVTYGGEESVYYGITHALLPCIYYPASNLLGRKDTGNRLLRILGFSGFSVSLFFIAEVLSGNTVGYWMKLPFLFPIREQISERFGGAEILALFLLFGVMASLVQFDVNRRHGARFLYACFALTNLAALVLTASRGAWIAAVSCILAYFLWRFRKVPFSVKAIVPLIPAAYYYLPETEMNRLFSVFGILLPVSADVPFSYRVSVWKSLYRLLDDYGVAGIGVGKSAFTALFPQYADSVVSDSEDACSLYLQTAAENGIIGILSLLLLIGMLIFVIAKIHTRRYAPSFRSQLVGICATLFAVFLNGISFNIFGVPQLLMLTFLFIGFLAAAVKSYSNGSGSKQMPNSGDGLTATVDIAVHR